MRKNSSFGKFSRVLSFVLTLCMVVGLLPAIASEPAKAATTLYYDFTALANSGLNTDYTKTITYDMVAGSGKTTQPWAFNAYTTDATASGNTYFMYVSAGVGFYLGNGVREKSTTASLKFKVSTAGSYIPMLNIKGVANWADSGFAMVSIKSGTTTLASKPINFANYTAANHYVALSDKGISLAANGEYILELASDKVKGKCIVDGLKLVPVGSATAADLVIDHNSGLIEVNMGSTKTVDLDVTMASGTANLSNVTFEYSTANIATAAISGNQIKVTPVATGTTTLTVRYGDAMARTNIKVNAAGTTVAAGDLVYNFLDCMPQAVESVVNLYYGATHTMANVTPGAYGEAYNTAQTSAPYGVEDRQDRNGNSVPDFYFSRLYQSYGFLHSTVGNGVLRIRVPVSGKYTASTALQGSTAVSETISFWKPGAASYIAYGVVSSGASGTVNLVTTPMNLEAGDYLVKFNKTSSGNNIFNSLTLKYAGAYDANAGTGGNEGGNTGGNEGGNTGGNEGGTTTPTDPVITLSIGSIANIVVGDTANALLAITVNGAASNFANATSITATASDTSVLTPTVTKSGNSASLSVKALKAGSSTVTVTAKIGGKDYTASKLIRVTETPSETTSADLFFYADQTAIAPSQTDGVYVHVTDRKLEPISAKITYSSTDDSVITVDSTGKVKPVKVGKAEIVASLNYKNKEYSLTLPFSVTEGKSAASYYTGERVEALRENRNKYQWALDDSVNQIKKADWYIENIEDLYGMITTQELPRSATVGYRWDPDMFKCRYCGIDLASSNYGSYGWMLDPINKPWQVTCPDCRKTFPSNDFGKFYELGIKEDGNWSYELAKNENAKLVAAGQTGYLVNEKFPEKGAGWGVDDGYGYKSGVTVKNTQGNNAEQVHTYISYYNHWGVWYGSYGGDNAGLMTKVMNTLTEAYLNTGDVKYGKVGAMLVDRVADVYPDMYIAPYFPNFFNSDSTTPKGKMVGCIWQHGLSRAFVLGYDAFYDAYDDPRVLEYIQQQSGRHPSLKYDKSNAVAIREHIENDLILQTYKDIRNSNIFGNFGMHQSLSAYTGVIYDSMPKTKEILDWTYANQTSGTFGSDDVNGGNVTAQLINLVDRDGLGSESGANYNVLWINAMLNIFGATEGYTKYTGADSFQNPRVQKMFKAYLPLTLARKATVQIGDSGATAKSGYQMTNLLILKGFMNTGDVEMAQFLYHINDGNMLDVHADKWTKNPEAVQQQVLDIIREHGEYDFDRSQILPAYGFSILRDGTYKKAANAANSVDTQRDMWMYYGAANSHKHADVLNLGIEAFGISVLPDLGYPTTADGSDRTNYWESGTAMHATVMVNSQSHNRIRSYNNGTPRNNGRPLHFDDSGRVKVMDSIAPTNATNAGGTFRRSVVMIKVDDENSYGVDFFRVQGGNTHHYNFHALSNKIAATEGLTLTAQNGGTYAGTDVAFGKTGVASGFSYLYNVRTSPSTTGNFAVDFNIEDFRREGWGDKDIHLRVTMLNGFALEHVAIAKGKAPIRDDNPEELEFVLAKRSGTNIDSLFTAVYEPYKGARFITKIESVPVSTTARVAKAVKVTRADGLVDYIVYCNDETANVRVDNKFDFTGFIGVYTEKNGQVAYTYGQEATKVGPTTGTKNYTGTITDFTKTLSKQNYITVQFNSAIDPSKIIGKLLVDTSVTTDNANVIINGAESLGSNKYKLDIGDASMITAVNNDGSYKYNCAVGNNVSVPLALIGSAAPVFNKINNTSTEVGAEVKFTVSATGAAGKTLTYKMTSGASNATFDATTGQFSWIPASSHRGDNVFAFEVSDGVLTDTMYVTITVFGGSPGPAGPGGGGGGGGGGENSKLTVKFDTDGGSSVASKQVAKGEKVEKPADPTKEGYTFDGWYLDAELTNKYDFDTTVTAALTLYAKWVASTEEPTTGEEGRKFIDLGNHKWAEDAIYRLVDAGVVNGTSATTYAPGVNITRADFTTLIVRAFKFEADVATFADVDSSKYYATPIGIAKTLGVVGGVNETDFAPTKQITRQDMMVIIYRALKVAGVEIEKTQSPTFSDMNAVASYAKEAVEALTGAGLIAGSGGKINPKANTTRAEVAVVLDRILNK